MNIIWQLLNSLRKQDISKFSLLALLLVFIAVSYAEIPLPKQNIAQSSGLTAGMGIGTLKSTSCKTLWAWTGHIHHSYNSLFTSGASIKFLGGNLDSSNNIINQRYSIDTRITHNEPNYVLFIGPVFSFENTNLSTLRNEFSNIGDKASDVRIDTQCSNTYEKIGSSIGYQSGVGFLVLPSLGFSLGHDLDLTLKGTIIASFNGSIAYNLRELFEKLINNTKNFWLALEYSALLSEGSTNIHNVILGLAVGF
jgi:hypothetical protein